MSNNSGYSQTPTWWGDYDSQFRLWTDNGSLASPRYTLKTGEEGNFWTENTGWSVWSDENYNGGTWSSTHKEEIMDIDISFDKPEKVLTLQNITYLLVDNSSNVNEIPSNGFFKKMSEGTSMIKGLLSIISEDEIGYSMYKLSSFTQLDGYYQLGVTYLTDTSGNNLSFTNNENCKLQLVQTGDRGSQGFQGFQGFQGYTAVSYTHLTLPTIYSV